jgi:hypothetical protein
MVVGNLHRRLTKDENFYSLALCPKADSTSVRPVARGCFPKIRFARTVFDPCGLSLSKSVFSVRPVRLHSGQHRSAAFGGLFRAKEEALISSVLHSGLYVSLLGRKRLIRPTADPVWAGQTDKVQPRAPSVLRRRPSNEPGRPADRPAAVRPNERIKTMNEGQIHTLYTSRRCLLCWWRNLSSRIPMLGLCVNHTAPSTRLATAGRTRCAAGSAPSAALRRRCCCCKAGGASSVGPSARPARWGRDWGTKRRKGKA